MTAKARRGSLDGGLGGALVGRSVFRPEATSIGRRLSGLRWGAFRVPQVRLHHREAAGWATRPPGPIIGVSQSLPPRHLLRAIILRKRERL